MKDKRLDLDKLDLSSKHWSEAIASEIIDNIKTDNFTCAAGISPSGTVHFGNFRDVITAFAVHLALKKLDKNSRCIFSWDNFDRFRKVPANVPKEFEKYIGMPLSAIPSPVEGFSSYAEYFQKPFEIAMQELGIDLEYKYQTDEYKSGRYDDMIFLSLQKRKEIAKILLSFMTEKGKEEGGINEEEYIENYYPISVYSRFTNKDSTKVLSYDGLTSITYKCAETGNEETVDLSKDRIAKLAWKVDWPMRWKEENVVFEPGGHDHASPGSSYDVSSLIAKKIFNIEEPFFAEYKFVGIQGGGSKMSGSKGNAISPKELLDIYEPELLKWLYFRRRPDQPFSLAFDTEIYRQYDEFDREVENPSDSKSTSLSGHKGYKNPIPFKQAVSLGQITQWNYEKTINLIKDINADYDNDSVRSRLEKAKSWLQKYNPEEAITLRDSVNKEYAESMDENSKNQVRKLKEELKKEYDSVEDLEKLVYSIPKDNSKTDKENAPAQRVFFKHLYNLLIDKDAGPRLSTFLWAIDRSTCLKLLDI